MECLKISFSKKEADAALKELKSSGKQYRKEKRAYYCLYHNAWHLTSVEDKNKVEPKDIRLKYAKKWKKLLNN